MIAAIFIVIGYLALIATLGWTVGVGCVVVHLLIMTLAVGRIEP